MIVKNTKVGTASAVVVSVRDFGALGDDSHDDTTAIQEAINASVTFHIGFDL